MLVLIFSLDLDIVYLVRDPRAVMESRKEINWCMNNADQCFHPARHCHQLEEDYVAAKAFAKRYPKRVQ